VAAHLSNIPMTVLEYPAEQVKLNGLARLINTQTQTQTTTTVAQLKQANQHALKRVRDLLRDKKNKKRQGR
jgi:hypothetical protein